MSVQAMAIIAITIVTAIGVVRIMGRTVIGIAPIGAIAITIRGTEQANRQPRQAG